MSSNQTAGAFFLLLRHRNLLLSNNDPHGFVENILEALLRKSAALHVLAVKFLFDDFAGGLPHNGGILRILFGIGIVIPQVDFVPHKDLRDVRHVVLKFGIPLSR